MDQRRVFGLTISMNQLMSHRRKRIKDYEHVSHSDYVNPKTVRMELNRGAFPKLWNLCKSQVDRNSLVIKPATRQWIPEIDARIQRQGEVLHGSRERIACDGQT